MFRVDLSALQYWWNSHKDVSELHPLGLLRSHIYFFGKPITHQGISPVKFGPFHLIRFPVIYGINTLKIKLSNAYVTWWVINIWDWSVIRIRDVSSVHFNLVAWSHPLNLLGVICLNICTEWVIYSSLNKIMKIMELL